MKPSIFILSHPFGKQKHRTIRLCIPGIDQGGAVWMEAEIEGDDEYCKSILQLIHKALPETVIEEL